jgi:hypothetical protein
LLDHEEALALQDLTTSVQGLGEELCSAIDLRGRIRRYPLLSTGLAALLGYFGVPPLVRGLLGGVALVQGFSVVRPARPKPGRTAFSASLRAVRDHISR